MTVDLRASEFAWASVWMTLHSFRWMLGILACMILLLVIAEIGRPSDASSVLGQIALLVSVIVLLFVGGWLNAYWRFRRMPAHMKTCTWTFFPDHVECSGEVANSTMTWAAFAKIREIRPAFLLYPQTNLCFIIPKRALGEPGDVDRFRRLCKEASPKAARVKAVAT